MRYVFRHLQTLSRQYSDFDRKLQVEYVHILGNAARLADPSMVDVSTAIVPKPCLRCDVCHMLYRPCKPTAAIRLFLKAFAVKTVANTPKCVAEACRPWLRLSLSAPHLPRFMCQILVLEALTHLVCKPLEAGVSSDLPFPRISGIVACGGA